MTEQRKNIDPDSLGRLIHEMKLFAWSLKYDAPNGEEPGVVVHPVDFPGTISVHPDVDTKVLRIKVDTKEQAEILTTRIALSCQWIFEQHYCTSWDVKARTSRMGSVPTSG